MKKFYFSMLLIFSFINSYAQKQEKFYDWEWDECKPMQARFYSVVEKKDSLFYREDFFIREKSLQMKGSYLDSTCKIAKGKFYYFHANGNLERTGNYVNGKKEGLWLSYHNNKMMSDSTFYENGNIIGTSMSWYNNGFPADSTTLNEDAAGVSVGWFDNGFPSYAGRYSESKKKTGKWTYFHKNGQRSALETYSADELTEKKYFNEDGIELFDTNNRDKKAVFAKGEKAWHKYINRGLYFPNQYKIENTDSAIVVVQFTVNEDGKVENVIVTNPFYPAFDRIVVNVLRSSPKWLPAISHNRNVKTIITQTVNFIQNTKE
jgi:antitoxin component YwqK of YwqJK toxin-antitoxin module